MDIYPFPPAVEVNAQFISQRARAASVAAKSGYFWLPCPLCGIEFGGHESGFTDDDVYPGHIPDEYNPPVGNEHGLRMGYKCICPYCTAAKRGWDWPPSAYEEILS